MPITDGQTATIARLRAKKRDEAKPTEARLTDDSVVMFEGEPTRWGDMMRQDRKAYLSGDGFYPF